MAAAVASIVPTLDCAPERHKLKLCAMLKRALPRSGTGTIALLPILRDGSLVLLAACVLSCVLFWGLE